MGRNKILVNLYSGEKVGNLTLIEKIFDGKWSWRCKCECGKPVVRKESVLLRVKKGYIAAVHCGCKSKLLKVGQKVGSLILVKLVYTGIENDKWDWLCICEHGKEVRYNVDYLTEIYTGKKKNTIICCPNHMSKTTENDELVI